MCDCNKWKDIETAPQDGTHILLYAGKQEYQGKPVEPRITYGYWLVLEHGDYLGDCGGECRCPEFAEAPDPHWYSEDGGFTPENPPTRWMPLPAPPSDAPTPTPLDPDTAAANAVMIAAIPEMLEAINDCQSLLAMIYHMGPDSKFWNAEGVSKLLEDQLASNRAALASIGRTL